MNDSVFTDATDGEEETQQQRQQRDSGEDDVGEIPFNIRRELSMSTPTISVSEEQAIIAHFFLTISMRMLKNVVVQNSTATADGHCQSSFSVDTIGSAAPLDTVAPPNVFHHQPYMPEVYVSDPTAFSVHHTGETSSMSITDEQSRVFLDPYALSEENFALSSPFLFDCKEIPASATSERHHEGAAGTAFVRPPHPDPQNAPIASEKNPKTALKEYYDQCEPRVTLTKGSFVCVADTSEGQHCPFFTCVFVCPETGELFLSGHLLNAKFGGDQCHERNGLVWYKTKDKSQFAAAGRALDCFRFRGTGDEDEMFCKEDPYSTADAASIEYLGKMHYHRLSRSELRKIYDLQAKTPR